ncbi:MAG: hypothetical protein NVSMB18_10300 [Acetobacteraceae bacterium]
MAAQYRKIIVEHAGPPEVMRLVADTLGAPGPGEVLIRQDAVGVDFIDTQLRSGAMPATFPTGLGFAAAGVVDVVGGGVSDVEPGDRVAYSHTAPGSYAEARIVPADRVVRLPDQSLPADIAAGALFRGLTAWYLATRLREATSPEAQP